MTCSWTNRKYLLHVSVAVFISIALPAFKKKQDCYSAASSQARLNQCANEAAKKTAAELENVFELLLKKTSSTNQAKLQAAREAWTTYRAKQCEFNNLGTEGGSIHPMIASQCYADMTNDYIKVLQLQLRCQEGNMSCGGQ